MLSIVVVLWYRGNNNVDDLNQENQSLLPKIEEVRVLTLLQKRARGKKKERYWLKILAPRTLLHP
jgi:hypothetical protein